MAEFKVPSTIATYVYQNGKQVKSEKTSSQSNKKQYKVNPDYQLDKSKRNGKGEYVKVDRTANMSKGEKYYYDLSRNDPEAYIKARTKELEKRKKSDGTYYQTYYEYLAATDPEAYIKAREEYLYDSDTDYSYEYEPEERGLLDRIFGVLGYNGIVEGLYNLTDNDDSTTFMQGLKEGFHNMNPFEDDVSQRNTFSDVLKNLGWEDKQDGSPNVLRGITGFVGDVLLDPLTYVNPFGSAAKIVKGSGATIDTVDYVRKAAKAAQIAGKADDAAKGTVRAEQISKVKGLSYEEARKIVRENHRSLTDEEINKLTVERLRGYENKVKKVVDLDKGDGLSIGLKHAIPGTKKMDKALSKFTKELISSETLRTLGDKTIAPYYNSLMKNIRNTRIMGALSENNRLSRVSSKLGDVEAFKQFSLGQSKKEFTKAAQNVEDLSAVDKIKKNLEDSGYTDEEFIADHEDEILDSVAELRGAAYDVANKNKDVRPVNKYGYNESEKNILEGRAEVLRSNLDELYKNTHMSEEEFAAKYQNYDGNNISSDLESNIKAINDYGDTHQFNTKYKHEAEAMFGKSVDELETAEKAKFYNLMSMLENASGQIKWRDILKTMGISFTKKTITSAKNNLLKTLGKDDSAAEEFINTYKSKKNIQPTNDFSALNESYKFLSNYEKASRIINELDLTESTLKNLYTDDDFLEDVEDGLYDMVIQNRQLKIYAAQKALESQRNVSDTVAALERLKADKKELSDLQNNVKNTYESIMKDKPNIDYKAVSSVIESKEKELYYLEKNAEKKVKRTYDKIDKLSEEQKAIQADIQTAHDKLNLFKKYWREIQYMTGKNVDEINVDDTVRCTKLLDTLTSISIGDKINWKQLFSHPMLEDLIPGITSEVLQKYGDSIPDKVFMKKFLQLNETNQSFIIDDIKKSIENDFFDVLNEVKQQAKNSDKPFDYVYDQMNEIFETLDDSQMTNYTKQLFEDFRKSYPFIGDSDMYNEVLKLLAGSFSSGTRTKGVAKVLENATVGWTKEELKKLTNRLVNNRSGIANLEKDIEKVIGDYDVSHGNLSEEIKTLKDEIQTAKDDMAARKAEYNEFLKTENASNRLFDLSNEISALNRITGNSVIDDMVVYSSADDYLAKHLGVTSDELKRIEKLNENEQIIELHKTFADRMSEIAEREFKSGRLNEEQIAALDGKYMHRILSDEAKAFIKDNPDIYKDTGKFNPSAHGNKKSFDSHRIFKTMADGEKWWIERNKQVVFDDLIEKGYSEEEAAKWLEENFDVNSIGKLYKYNVAEMYITRAIGSNELLLSTDINNFVKHSLCTPYTPNQAVDAYKDKVVASYIDVFNNLAHYFNKNKNELTEEYGNVKNFIDSVVREAGIDEKVFAKGKDFSKLEEADINTTLFSPNFAYFDLTEAQRQIFQKYSEKPIELWNMDKGVYNLVNKFTKDQMSILQSNLLNFYDKWLTRWKVFNILSPGFHLQNALSNTFQSFLAIGTDAFNPKKIKKSLDVYRTKDPKQTMTLAGKKYTYKELADLVDEYNVISNTFFDEDVLSKSNEKGIIGKLYNIHGKFGADIESTGRINLFFSALNDGKSPQEAAEMVDKFLFDYSDLTQAEKNIMKRIIPFYSFMRKNIPLMLEQMLEQPNTFNNLNKAFTEIEKMNPDYVPENNRSEYRQDYIQFPFAINGKQYGIADQLPYTQLDRVFSLKSTDNVPVSLPRQLMGQTSPILKLPFELITGESAYSGMPLSDSKANYIANLLGGNAGTIANTLQKQTTDEAALYGLGKFLGFPVATISDYSVPAWERPEWIARQK